MIQDTDVKWIPKCAKNLLNSRSYARKFAKFLAPAVFSCVFSPIPLIILGGAAEYGVIKMSEDLAGGLGTAILLLIIAVAVAVMIMSGLRMGKYEYLEKEEICWF